MTKKAASTFMHPVKSEQSSGADSKAGEGNEARSSRGARGTKSYYVLSPIHKDGRAYAVGEEVEVGGDEAERMLRHNIIGDKETDSSKAEVERADYQKRREDEADKASVEERHMMADLQEKAKAHPELRGHLGAAATLGSEVMFPEAHPGAPKPAWLSESQPDESKGARKSK
jgi:hypothetical protein